ncbi:MAG: M3 family metallopeptidase [Paludibacteraceae bacterium]|nr:M3 family metallopeptidase [Paludibacteraceae bacterium]
MLTACHKNPFMDRANWTTPHGAYPFDQIENDDYLPAFEEGIKQGLADIDAIVNNPEAPTFENTIVALDEAGDLLTCVSGCFYNLTHSETNETLQELEQILSPKMSEYSTSIRLNEGLFQRIKAVYDQRESLNLDKDQLKLLEDTYESFANNGANLSPEQKEQYRVLRAELSRLTLTYGQNVLKATNAWTKLITDEAELAGLKPDTKDMLRQKAQAKELDGWLLDLQPTTYIPFMQDCENRALREELYRAYNTRALGGEFDNTPLIVQIANTRLKLAQLFDKRNYAEKSLHKTCAETQENVMNLLDQLRVAYLPAAKAEMKELNDYAHSLGFKGDVQPWDFSFYSKKLQDAKYSISDDILRPYFPLEQVKSAVFGLANRLYGLTFVENKDIPVYHPEVCAYEVFDPQGNFLAIYYADFHPREGKRGGAWMNDFQAQYVRNGVDHRPHIVNVTNFTRPTADKPALLTYSEAETFLHEFGHALHGMLTRCRYSSQSGTAVPRDFVELPSQFNENFLGEREFLDAYARHYETGEAMPQELIDRIKAADTYHAAYACLRQLSFGYPDMAWHTLTAPFEVPDGDTLKAVIEFGNKAMASTQITPLVPGTQMETAFTHIFSGGYAAGYYSYKWSELLDADAFAQFQQARDLRGSIFDKETADRFRTNILERGGTEEPMVLYRRFRGGEPTIDALLRRDGIKK